MNIHNVYSYFTVSAHTAGQDRADRKVLAPLLACKKRITTQGLQHAISDGYFDAHAPLGDRFDAGFVCSEH